MERPSSTESMLSDIPVSSLPAHDSLKQRCPIPCNNTFYYYTEQGISLRCRHCKSIIIVEWEEIFRKHQEVQGKVGLD